MIDANNYLEILPGETSEVEDGFIVWLFDCQIGEGATIEEAMEDARENVARWTELHS